MVGDEHGQVQSTAHHPSTDSMGQGCCVETQKITLHPDRENTTLYWVNKVKTRKNS